MTLVKVPTQAEQCICAAIKLPNGEVWRGHRHDDAIRTAGLANCSQADIFAAEQGFITSRNRFVSREEGARIQCAAGILSAHTREPVHGLLFSEDLYLRHWREAEQEAPSFTERKQACRICGRSLERHTSSELDNCERIAQANEVLRRITDECAVARQRQENFLEKRS